MRTDIATRCAAWRQERRKPSRAEPSGSQLDTPEQIPLGEDPNYSAFGVDYRQTAYARLQHKVHRVFKGRVRTRGNGRERHNIGSFHSSAPFGGEYGATRGGSKAGAWRNGHNLALTDISDVHFKTPSSGRESTEPVCCIAPMCDDVHRGLYISWPLETMAG